MMNTELIDGLKPGQFAKLSCGTEVFHDPCDGVVYYQHIQDQVLTGETPVSLHTLTRTDWRVITPALTDECPDYPL